VAVGRAVTVDIDSIRVGVVGPAVLVGSAPLDVDLVPTETDGPDDGLPLAVVLQPQTRRAKTSKPTIFAIWYLLI